MKVNSNINKTLIALKQHIKKESKKLAIASILSKIDKLLPKRKILSATVPLNSCTEIPILPRKETHEACQAIKKIAKLEEQLHNLR